MSQIVADAGQTTSGGWTSYAAGPPAAAVQTRRREARPAAETDQCAINVEKPIRFEQSDAYKVQGTARNVCTAAASYQEIYATIERYNSSLHDWLQLDTGMSKGRGGEIITAKGTYGCTKGNLRSYRTKGFAYSVVGGKGYTITKYAYENHYCSP